MNNGGCSQVCINTDGSRNCQCFTGYSLNIDGRTCSGNDFLKSIYLVIIDFAPFLGPKQIHIRFQNYVFFFFFNIMQTSMNVWITTEAVLNFALISKEATIALAVLDLIYTIQHALVSEALMEELPSTWFLISDKNECSRGISGCSQVCDNTYGSFICSCYPGYALSFDGISCFGMWISE